jgi:hypothetical protein
MPKLFFAKHPIARERHKIGDQAGDVTRCVRPVGVARYLHLLPGRQAPVALLQQPVGLGFEPADFLGDVEAAVGRQMAQLVDLAFEFGNRPLKIQEVAHCLEGYFRCAKGCAVSIRRRSRSL